MKRRVFIDAGHGGKDPGALGPKGLRESNVALSVALLLGAALGSHVEVGYSRKDDTFLSLEQRAAKANAWNADLFISIHCNSGESGKGDGFEVFTTPGYTAADPFATSAFLAYAEAFPEKRKRMDDSDGDPDKEANFAVLRRTECPAILFELEFIHTAAGEAWLGDKANQKRCADALANGILRHLGIQGIPVSFPSDDVAPVPVGRVMEAAAAEVAGMLGETRGLIAQLTSYVEAQQDRINALRGIAPA